MPEEDNRPQYKPTKVRQWLKKRGKTQAELADYLGTSRPQVTRILSGQRQYTQAFIEGASVFLDVPVRDLLDREPDAPSDAVVTLLERAPLAVRQEIARFAEFAIKRGTGDS